MGRRREPQADKPIERPGSVKELARSVERTYLVGICLQGQDIDRVEESLDELALLAETAGALVVGRAIQNRRSVSASTYIGEGKINEIKAECTALGAETIVFDDELSPSQQRNIEKLVDRKVVDRTALILDIFSDRASSSEGKLQVELAQLSYILPRLRGRGVQMSRQGGGLGGARRGPGETKLEVDRRRILTRISTLKKELEKVGQVRQTQRKSRERSQAPTITLVGYTNAGKSTLLNTLTSADVLAEDMLFATLDSTTRRLRMPSGATVLLSDTVGFIRKLPHELVSAFRSTLDEVRDADLLLHVMDASSDEVMAQMGSVIEVLGELGCSDKPRIDVMNKTDLLDPDEVGWRTGRVPRAIAISAVTGEGVSTLLERLESALAEMAQATIAQK